MEQVARRNRQWTVRVRWKILFVLLGAAGVALRVWVHRSALGIPDSDEAVVGLMVDHAMRGEPTTFFWGQAYGGSQEALLTVPVFWIAGSSWLTLRLVPIALSVVAAVVVWRVGRRTIGEPAAGVAGGLAWIWPPFVIYKLTHQWGFYASGTLYSALVLLLTLRLAERPSKARAGTFGLVVGLALWQSAQLVPIVVTAIVWAVWRRRSVLRYAWIAAVFAVIGALPSIVWNVRQRLGVVHVPDRRHHDVPAPSSRVCVPTSTHAVGTADAIHPGAAPARHSHAAALRGHRSASRFRLLQGETP